MYAIHCNQTGIRWEGTKNLANKICGIMTAGINSGATFGSSTELPGKMPSAILIMVKTYKMAQKSLLVTDKPTMKYVSKELIMT